MLCSAPSCLCGPVEVAGLRSIYVQGVDYFVGAGVEIDSKL